jgi:hypothetical protein
MISRIKYKIEKERAIKEEGKKSRKEIPFHYYHHFLSSSQKYIKNYTKSI